MNRLAATSFLVVCVACAGTSVSERGRAVSDLGSGPIPADCQRVKDVWASEGCGWLKSDENCKAGVQNQLRNEAAALGATHVRYTPVTKGVADYQGSGMAYRCPNSAAR